MGAGDTLELMLTMRHVGTMSRFRSQKSHVFISAMLRRFALGLSTLFVPVYLYELGKSLEFIALFFMVVQLTKTLLYLPVVKLISKFGVNHAIAISYLFASLQMMGYFLAKNHDFGMVVALLAAAIADVLYWSAMHIDLARLVESKSMNKNIGLFVFLGMIAGASAPLVGGVAATVLGPEYIFIMGLVVLIIATAVLKGDMFHEPKGEVFRVGKPSRNIIGYSLASWADNLTSTVSTYAWPMYIFLIVGGFDNLGFLMSFGLVLGSIAVLYVKNEADTRPGIFTAGYWARISSFPLRFLAVDPISAVATNTFNEVTSNSFYGIPYGSEYHKNAKHDTLNYVFWVELFGEFGKLCGWVIVLLAALMLDDTQALRYAVLAATIFVPLTWLIKHKNS